jgi:hypothetical protein
LQIDLRQGRVNTLACCSQPNLNSAQCQNDAGQWPRARGKCLALRKILDTPSVVITRGRGTSGHKELRPAGTFCS